MEDVDPYKMIPSNMRNRADEYGFSQPFDVVYEKKRSVAVKIIASVLIVTVLLTIACLFFVSPVDELILRLGVLQSCTINIGIYSSRNQWGGATVLVDGNVFAIAEYGSYVDMEYYSFEDGKLYYHNNYDEGKWNKHEAFHSELQDGVNFGKMLLDRNNYERIKWNPFVWQLDDSIRIEGMKNVRIKRGLGKIIITADMEEFPGELFYKIIIDQFGRTQIDRPWET